MQKRDHSSITGSGWLIAGIILIITAVRNIHNALPAVITILIGMAMIMRFADVQHLIKINEEWDWDYDNIEDDLL